MAREPTAMDDGLSEAERKFLSTGGESGLPEEPETPPPAEPAPAPAPAPAPETPPAPAVQEPPAAAPASAATEEDDEGEPAVDPATGKKPPRQVNFNKYKRLQDDFEAQGKQLSEMREMMTRADERMKIINDALSPPTPEQQEAIDQDPEPDPTKDIFGYLQWQRREMGRMQERYDAQINDMREHVSTREQADQVVATYKQSAVEFAQRQPAFAQAYNYLVRNRLAELEAMGYDKPTRDSMIVEEEFGQVHAALRGRVNPAERIYNLAVARGFKPGAAPTPSPPGATPAPAAPSAAPRPGAAGPPAAFQPNGQPNVAAIIDSVTSGQAAATSLSRGGGAPADQLTSEWLAGLNEEDFGRVVDRLTKSQLRALLPGA